MPHHPVDLCFPARTLLHYSHLGIAEIAAAVGFTDTPSFSHACKRVFDLPPSFARTDFAVREPMR